MLLRRTTLRQLLMRPPHSVRAWLGVRVEKEKVRVFAHVHRDTIE